ncbi:hypothetical protein NHX12_030046 [Muraenolepis orangiensis]|uniref:Uncharacterized protein n=1 Tax=Muraenolepis orangiensis TaxID=630683 RepID=A0A9Q0E731_9TELE|nr:hypothetical protein NHX12_030046 [Muraenolepis orangiensis]
MSGRPTGPQGEHRVDTFSLCGPLWPGPGGPQAGALPLSSPPPRGYSSCPGAPGPGQRFPTSIDTVDALRASSVTGLLGRRLNGRPSAETRGSRVSVAQASSLFPPGSGWGAGVGGWRGGTSCSQLVARGCLWKYRGFEVGDTRRGGGLLLASCHQHQQGGN